MEEVVVVVTFEAKPERVDEAEDALCEMAAATHAEDGCLRYALHRVRGDETTFLLVESWASQPALDQHLRQPHVAAFSERSGDLLARPADIRFCTALPAGDPIKGAL